MLQQLNDLLSDRMPIYIFSAFYINFKGEEVKLLHLSAKGTKFLNVILGFIIEKKSFFY